MAPHPAPVGEGFISPSTHPNTNHSPGNKARVSRLPSSSTHFNLYSLQRLFLLHLVLIPSVSPLVKQLLKLTSSFGQGSTYAGPSGPSVGSDSLGRARWVCPFWLGASGCASPAMISRWKLKNKKKAALLLATGYVLLIFKHFK